MIWDIIVCVIYFQIVKVILKIAWEILKEVMPNNWVQKYGLNQNKWAIVTGATDGVGLGFVQQLASSGSNTVLISRNKEKLQRRISQIQEQLRKEKKKLPHFKYIVADFKDSSQKGFIDSIVQQLEGLDISVLVNNVGTSEIRAIQNYKPQKICDIINVNCTSMAVLTSALIPRLNSEHSAIINLSSVLASIPVPYVTIYSATKAFNTLFSQGVSMEKNLKNIDILSVRPFFVESPLSRAKKGFLVPTGKQCARACMRELKWCCETNGYFIHRIMGIFSQMIPKFIFRIVGRGPVATSMQPKNKK